MILAPSVRTPLRHTPRGSAQAPVRELQVTSVNLLIGT